MQAAPSIQKLLDELERLPGVGPKSAQRMAYWILNTDASEALRLARSPLTAVHLVWPIPSAR